MKRYNVNFEVEGFIELEEDDEAKAEEIVEKHLILSMAEPYTLANWDFDTINLQITEE